MKILVPIKRVIDYNVHVRVKADESGVETNNVKMSVNPFDEIAVEEAIKLKEDGIADDTAALSIGANTCQETLRTTLAMGLDRAIHISTNHDLEPLSVAKAIKMIVEKDRFDLVILGKQAIDDDMNQTGQMLAGLLDWPQATFASKCTISKDQITVTREIDGGLETIAVNLPAVITTDLRLNTPRYASLPNIMKARAKPMEVIEYTTINPDYQPRLHTHKVVAPLARQAGIKVDDVDSLLDKLKNEAKVI